MNLHRFSEERSIALHAAVAACLLADPSLVQKARERVRSWQIIGSRPYAVTWARCLDLPIEELCELLIDPGEEMRALRQCSPFAGVLDPRTRWRIMHEFRDRMGV